MGVLKLILNFLGGGIVTDLADQLRRAHEAKLKAQTSDQKLAADLDMQRLENAIAIAQVAASDRWGATSVGRYLLVVPFGLWYTLVIADSCFNFSWDVLALPERVMRLSEVLIPVIVVGDLGNNWLKRRTHGTGSGTTRR